MRACAARAWFPGCAIRVSARRAILPAASTPGPARSMPACRAIKNFAAENKTFSDPRALCGKKGEGDKMEKELIALRVNGELHEVAVPANRTLMDALREDLGLTGTKHGCDDGD